MTSPTNTDVFSQGSTDASPQVEQPGSPAETSVKSATGETATWTSLYHYIRKRAMHFDRGFWRSPYLVLGITVLSAMVLLGVHKFGCDCLYRCIAPKAFADPLTQAEIHADVGPSGTDDINRMCFDTLKCFNRSLDVFKGVLTILMTQAHVDLSLASTPSHMIGNMAGGLCFLGFLLAYGFACDTSYLSDWKFRGVSERFMCMMQSALKPLCAAWICSLGWAFLHLEAPLNRHELIRILSLYNSWGNGPDFLLCFTCCLLIMYPLRHWINIGLSSKESWRCGVVSIVLISAPLLFTKMIVHDCLGPRKYLGYLLECTTRDSLAPVHRSLLLLLQNCRLSCSVFWKAFWWL